MFSRKSLLSSVVIIMCASCVIYADFLSAAQRDNVSCGITPGQPLNNNGAYGPYDAINPQHFDKLPIVINAHFTRDVEQLVKGVTSNNIMHDIDYTLRAIPNYHRALAAMSKYYRLKGNSEFSNFYTPECYFKRALYFQPKDGLVHAIYATNLHFSKKYNEAEKHYQIALKLTNNKIEINYNYGLLLVDKGEYDAAKAQAIIAYQAGYPLLGLRKKLKKKGISF